MSEARKTPADEFAETGFMPEGMRCETCCWWDAYECRFNPPTEKGWPHARKMDYCSKYARYRGDQ